MRRSKRPSKQLLWLWMEKVYKSSLNYEVGLDVACGTMDMYKYFKTKRYIGIDLDKDRIDQGLRENPNAIGIVKSIEELNGNENGDFVTCMQTIGINVKFDCNNTIKCVKNLVDVTNIGGMLIFNIGPNAFSYLEKIENYLLKNFEVLNVKKYGRFSEKYNFFISIVLTNIMCRYNQLSYSSKTPYALFLAKNKMKLLKSY